ncbi:MAG: O-antigen ligase family protein [Thermodesulfobacteriota bacterium]
MNSTRSYKNLMPVIIILGLSTLISISVLLFSAKFQYYYLLALAFGLPIGILVLRAVIISSSRISYLFSQLRWWHFLWLLVILSGLVFRIRDTQTSQQNPLDLWAFYRISLVGIIGLVLVARLITKKTDWFKVLFQGSIGLLAVYAIFGIASTFWSTFPFWSFYKSTEYLIDVALIAAIVVSVKNVEEFKSLFDLTWVLFGILVATAWIGLIFWPSLYKTDVGMIGLQIAGVIPAMETNQVGELAAILGIVALNRFLSMKDEKFYIVLFFVSMVTLIFSQSRSPIAGFLVAVPLMLFASRRIGPVLLTATLLFALLLFTGIADTFWEYFQRGQERKYFATFSGRTDMWALGWEVFKDSPLVGYGAYAGARFEVLSHVSSVGNWSSILNTWLEIILGVGIIGGILVGAAFVRTWINLLRVAFMTKSGSLINILAIESIGILALLSVRSIFTTVIIWHPPVKFFLLLGYSEFLSRRYLRKKSKKSIYQRAAFRP